MIKIMTPPKKGKRTQPRSYTQQDSALDFLLEVCIELQKEVRELKGVTDHKWEEEFWDDVNRYGTG